MLGALRAAAGDLGGAREAYRAALVTDPFLPEALANAGLLALDVGDIEAARARLRALRVIDPGADWPETAALAGAIARTTGRP
jgi:Flp pilus assembly protein TadD